ncbi:S1 RNA-binding domain-containing protein, partial [Enterobacter hormaechei]|nr:S1 RNA-binding domain-containing protein [Enterobacter hormaechei]
SVERDELLETLQEGSEVKGIVKNLTDYGAFVDLGGVDGLLHITDMAWKRVKHPSEIVNVGDEIQVKVLKFDRERTRVSLGLKQLGEDPWVAIAKRYPEGH